MSGRSGIGWIAVAIGIFCGCQRGLTAQPGTPEYAIQMASIAAKKRDFKSYTQFFTAKYQRSRISSTLSFMMIQVPIREAAISEGPQSVKAVDAVLVRENKILKLLGVSWDKLIEISRLGVAKYDALDELAAEIKDPGNVWSEILKIDSEVPVWYGRIENASIENDQATIKTFIEDKTIFDATMKLRKVNGEWRIDERVTK